MLILLRDEKDDDVDVDDDWRRRMVRRAQAFARPDCVPQRMVTEFGVCIMSREWLTDSLRIGVAAVRERVEGRHFSRETHGLRKPTLLRLLSLSHHQFSIFSTRHNFSFDID